MNDTLSLICYSFALYSVWKPMKITLEWCFCLVWLPSAFNLVFSTFLATANSCWIKVTRTTLVPVMDVLHIVLQEDPDTLGIIIRIGTLLQVTKMVYTGTFDKQIRYAATTSPVSFALALHSFNFRKFCFVLGFHIFRKFLLLGSLFQVMAMSSPHMSSTVVDLASRMMQTDGLGCTWIPILPHKLNLAPLILCLLVNPN